MNPAFVHPVDVEGLKSRLAPAFASLQRRAPPDSPSDIVGLLGDWYRYITAPCDWLTAPDELERGRDLEARLALAQGPAFAPPATTSTGSKWLRFVTPDDARDYKAQVNAIVLAVARDAQTCAALDDGTKRAWADYKAAWDKFMADDPGWLNPAAQMDRAEDFASQLHDWQARLEAHGCTISAPPIQSPDQTNQEIFSTAKTALIVGGAIVAVVLVRTVMGK